MKIYMLLVAAAALATTVTAQEKKEVVKVPMTAVLDSKAEIVRPETGYSHEHSEGVTSFVEADPDFHGDPPFLLDEGWIPMLNGRDLTGWRAADQENENQWVTTRAVHFDALRHPKLLVPSPVPGDRIVNGPDGKTVNLISEYQHGDIELFVEFMMCQERNASGIYLHGLYELQIYGSWDVSQMKTSDCGSIYHRWIDEKPVGRSPARVNACLGPGHWQSFHIWFRAPRFDPKGKKIANAKFEKVLFNGIMIQEDVEVEGGTRAHLPISEAPRNPLLLQGDHKSIAFRNIYYRPLD